MKLNLQQTILDIKGKIAEQKYKELNEKTGIEETISLPITLGLAIRDAVLYEVENAKSLSEEEHLKRFAIYEKVNNKDEAELTEDEVSFVKGLIARRWTTIFSAQFLRMFPVEREIKKETAWDKFVNIFK